MKILSAVSFLAIILLSQSCAKYEALDVAEFEKRMESEDDKIILDVRTPEEYNAGHLPDAILINYFESDFKQRLTKLDDSTPVFVYCAAGSRSEGASTTLRKLGFNEVYEMKGGIRAWRIANKRIVK